MGETRGDAAQRLYDHPKHLSSPTNPTSPIDSFLQGERLDLEVHHSRLPAHRLGQRPQGPPRPLVHPRHPPVLPAGDRARPQGHPVRVLWERRGGCGALDAHPGAPGHDAPGKDSVF